MPVAWLRGGNSFTTYWFKLVTLRTLRFLVKVQVDFIGIDTALKLVPIWHWCSHDGFRTGSKLFILKVRPHLYTHFLNNIHFLQKHSMHTLDCF